MFLAASVAVPPSALAQGAGDLVVSPTRVVFEGRDRSAQLSLVNKGSGTATFRISFVNMRMSDTGNLFEINKGKPDEKFAEKLIRYAPRQVTLKPGASQAIRLLLRKPGDLKDGEYRSHLMFRAVPKGGAASIERPKGEGVRVELVPVYGITIPVIVRHGQADVEARLDGLAIKPPAEGKKTPRLSLRIHRKGNASAFGNLTVTYSKGGKDLVIGQLNRLAVYVPNTSRTAEIELRVPDGVSLKGGKIKVEYKTEKNEKGQGGGKLLSTAAMDVP
ncbi:MAG: fimbria/pilus periplasmic chaperone [Rhodospirillales bacterium]